MSTLRAVLDGARKGAVLALTGERPVRREMTPEQITAEAWNDVAMDLRSAMNQVRLGTQPRLTSKR